MQEISSIYKLIIKIKQILSSHKLKSLTHFWSRPPIIFSFPEFARAIKKSVHSNCSFLRYSQFYNAVITLATLIFDNAHPKIFGQHLTYMNLCQQAKN